MNASSWNIKPADSRVAERIQEKFTLNPVIALVLAARGFSDNERTKQFLNTDLNDLAPPSCMEGMERCTERISEAVANKERILIYGDYDVDGITAVSILMRFFRTCGFSAEYIIPDRIDDGYGINTGSVSRIIEKKCSLCITVDCGMSAVEPVKMLSDRGIETIITDHHIQGDTVPDTPFIVNPTRNPETPCASLSGAGIAFKVAWGAAQKITGTEKVSAAFRKFLVSALPLAAIGTIADIVPLTGDNRILARHGLSLLSSSSSSVKGLRALMRAAGLVDMQKVTTYDIGFKIGPRLNAAGRMDNASKCVRLLTTESDEEAEHIASQLEQHNRERQKLCETTIQDAVHYIEEDIDIASCRAIIAGKPEWHRGIIGIVASKIAERYNRPSIILCRDGNDPDIWHASARSVHGFHITNALKECAPLLIDFGGHEGAAGLSIRNSDLTAFKQEFAKTAFRLFPEESASKTIVIDAVAEQTHLDITLAKDAEKLEPFGEGNDRPLILSQGLKVAQSPKLVGSNSSHLKLHLVAGPGILIDGIGFNMGRKIKEIIDADAVDLVFFPAVNEWKGRVSLDLHIKDIRKHEHV